MNTNTMKQLVLQVTFVACLVFWFICSVFATKQLFIFVSEIPENSEIHNFLSESSNFIEDKTGYAIDLSEMIDTKQHPKLILSVLLVISTTFFTLWYSYCFVAFGIYLILDDDYQAYSFEPEAYIISTQNHKGKKRKTNLTTFERDCKQPPLYGKYHPKRIYKLIMASFQQTGMILNYGKIYLKCKKLHNECIKHNEKSKYDLLKSSYMKLYDGISFQSILQKQFNEKFDYIYHQLHLENQEIEQSHFRDLVRHNASHVKTLNQVNFKEMMCISNIRYDKNDERYGMHIYAPVSPSFVYDNNEYRQHMSNYSKQLKNESSKKGIHKLDTVYDRMAMKPTPVAIFLYGGAWGGVDDNQATAMAQTFVSQNIALIYPRFASHPSGNIEHIISNISAIIEWVIRFHKLFNINHKEIILIGHSAGAQIGSMLIARSIEDNEYEWLKYIKLFVGLGGPYDILDHYYHESMRGVEALSSMGRCMKGVRNFHRYSPTNLLTKWSILMKHDEMVNDNKNKKDGKKEGYKQAAKYWPPTLLIHGTSDAVVPINSSIRFYNSLIKMGINVDFEKYENIDHYEPLFGLINRDSPIFCRLITDILTRFYINSNLGSCDEKSKNASKKEKVERGKEERENDKNRDNKDKGKESGGRKHSKKKKHEKVRLAVIEEQKKEEENKSGLMDDNTITEEDPNEDERQREKRKTEKEKEKEEAKQKKKEMEKEKEKIEDSMEKEGFVILQNEKFLRKRKEREAKQDEMTQKIRQMAQASDENEDFDDLTVDLLNEFIQDLDSSMNRMTKVKQYGDQTVNQILKLTKESL